MQKKKKRERKGNKSHNKLKVKSEEKSTGHVEYVEEETKEGTEGMKTLLKHIKYKTLFSPI